MPGIAGVNRQDAVRALNKVGLRIVRPGKHIAMSDGVRNVNIPRRNRVNAVPTEVSRIDAYALS